MLSDTTAGARRQLMPFDVVPGTRNCDDASPDQEYKRRKIDIPNGTGDESSHFLDPPCSNESTQSHPSSSHGVLARPAPLTVPDSPLHPHPHHYDPVPVPGVYQPPSASTPRSTSPSPFRTTTATARPAPRVTLQTRPWAVRRTTSMRAHQPYPQHEPGRNHRHGHCTGTPSCRSSSPTRTGTHPSTLMRTCTLRHENDVPEHDNWHPYAESERGPSAGTLGLGPGTSL
ncbi:hypothetical protein B0H13DRAFT_1880102 [Mycena leptocephala]|nr:hypothetical protein B0H13DRAFT_1880102 [Mycena leptocephala]